MNECPLTLCTVPVLVLVLVLVQVHLPGDPRSAPLRNATTNLEECGGRGFVNGFVGGGCLVRVLVLTVPPLVALRLLVDVVRHRCRVRAGLAGVRG